MLFEGSADYEVQWQIILRKSQKEKEDMPKKFNLNLRL